MPPTIDAPADIYNVQSPHVRVGNEKNREMSGKVYGTKGPDANAPTPNCKLRCRSKAAGLPVSFA